MGYRSEQKSPLENHIPISGPNVICIKEKYLESKSVLMVMDSGLTLALLYQSSQ